VAPIDDPLGGDPRISLSLLLPRDVESVPVVRHICEQLVASLGASTDAVNAIALALSEACSNVIRHAPAGADYRIDVEVGGDRCEIVVSYRDTGFDPNLVAAEPTEPTSESGRGLFLMRSLVDDLDFAFDPGRTRVRMTKDLEFAEATATRRLLRPRS
jgi:serine/threonine-protein kinase RsbW